MGVTVEVDNLEDLCGMMCDNRLPGRDGVTDQPIELTCDSFGEWLRQIKEENGYTYEYMAQKAGVSKYALHSYATRRRPPTLYSAERIVRAFGKRIVIV